MNAYTSPGTKVIYRLVQFIYYLLGLLEIVLAFRFVLKLLGANPAAGFTQFVYSLSHPFVAPFLTVFQVGEIQGTTFEWTTLLAMFVYWLIAVAIVQLLLMGKKVTTPEAAARLEQEI